MSSRKSKMVSFRLAPSEYERLQEACTNFGVRSVSEFARAAMYTLVDQRPIVDPTIDSKLAALRARLETLTADVENLTTTLRGHDS